jgi:gas vesicle protein
MTGLKFALGLGLGLAVGCLVAALLAPAAGEDVRQMLRERLRGGQPRLPDEAVTNSGQVTRGTRVSSASNVGTVGNLRARFEAAQVAMEQERREHENELWVRFRRALQTGRASEV